MHVSPTRQEIWPMRNGQATEPMSMRQGRKSKMINRELQLKMKRTLCFWRWIYWPFSSHNDCSPQPYIIRPSCACTISLCMTWWPVTSLVTFGMREREDRVTANEFASCVVDYLNEHLQYDTFVTVTAVPIKPEMLYYQMLSMILQRTQGKLWFKKLLSKVIHKWKWTASMLPSRGN